MSAEGKHIANAAYSAAVVSALAIIYARVSKAVFGGSSPKLDFTPKDAGMVALDLGLAVVTKDILVKQGIIPDVIVK